MTHFAVQNQSAQKKMLQKDDRTSINDLLRLGFHLRVNAVELLRQPIHGRLDEEQAASRTGA